MRFPDCLSQFGIVHVSPLYEIILISLEIITLNLYNIK